MMESGVTTDLFAPRPRPVRMQPPREAIDWSFQCRAKDAAIAQMKDGRRPVIEIPTGGGKSHVIAAIALEAFTSGRRVLMLAHVKELVRQQADKLRAASRGKLNFSVYSAGLKSKALDAPCVVAGVQSLYRVLDDVSADLGDWGCVVIDEAHMISGREDSMYGRILHELRRRRPDLWMCGLTATPYRLDNGMIYGDRGQMFDRMAYRVSVQELIDGGVLSLLHTPKTATPVDMSRVKIARGEYVESEAAIAFLATAEPAVAEMVATANKHERRQCLVFATNIAHAEAVCAMLGRAGESATMLFGHTPHAERDTIVEGFRAGKTKWLVNVGVLTTGFDAPETDCVCLMRATMSGGLYYQMVGRGFRRADGKDYCLVLDWGGNVARHGPVDEQRGKTAPITVCGECGEQVFATRETCPFCGAKLREQCGGCGHMTPVGVQPCRACVESREKAAEEEKAAAERKSKNPDGLDTDGVILSSQRAAPMWRDVKSVRYSLHSKPGKIPSMRVDYRLGMVEWVSEWVCFEHDGYAKAKAGLWWRARTEWSIPMTAADAARLAPHVLREAKQIITRPDGKFQKIINVRLGPGREYNRDAVLDRVYEEMATEARSDDEF